MILRVGYRFRQFLAALRFRGESIEDAALRAYLNTAQVDLFRRMPAAEQRHGLAVLRMLEKQGHAEASLAQAALLHDVGKVGGHVQLWHRVATVLLQAVQPALLHRMALNRPSSWRYPFFVQLYHASHGADMAADAGIDALSAALIRWHHTPPDETCLGSHEQDLVVALQSADDGN